MKLTTIMQHRPANLGHSCDSRRGSVRPIGCSVSGRNESNGNESNQSYERGKSDYCSVWLPDMDLNHDKQIQSLLCYRYTIGQCKNATVSYALEKARDRRLRNPHLSVCRNGTTH